MNDLLQLMHDTISPVNSIKGAVSLMKTTALSAEDTLMLLNAIEKKANELNQVLDSFYIKQKSETVLP